MIHFQFKKINPIVYIKNQFNLMREWLHDWIKFFFLLFLVVLRGFIRVIFGNKFVPLPLRLLSHKLYNGIDIILEKSSSKKYTISKIVLIEMAIKNMKFKKTRTMITIGGMALGIGAIVFLVSLGFGVQKLVIQRVARLEEMRQADAVPQPGSKILLSDKEYSVIKHLANVDKTLPVISMVGRVTFNNSVSDMPVYGVTSDYLALSAVKPVNGTVFKSNELSITAKANDEGDVAGLFIKRENLVYGDVAGDIQFSIQPEKWVEVRGKPDIESPIIGYTKRTEGHMRGSIVWGKRYSSFASSFMNTDQSLEQWIQSDFPLWERHRCDTANTTCDASGEYKKIEKSGDVTPTLYIGRNYATVQTVLENNSDVLGISDTNNEDVIDITNLVSSISANLDLATLASESAAVNSEKVKKVSIKPQAVKEAVITRAMVKVFGLTDSGAIGKKFTVTFVQTGSSPTSNEKIESNPVEYKIVGVTPEATTAYFYVPFIDLRGLGINSYSQMRIVAKNQGSLADIRKRVEALGFNTSSVVDTVSQIETLFGSARIVLAALGMVALFVAALGMFNTLTVSLMERTREIGLMRAIGMRSEEIRELFLVESMLMGLFGGIFGLLVGIVAGKIAGFLISIFTLLKGAGYVDISDLPFGFVLAVLSFSIFVGLITGIFPARRATRISALNALRYE